MRPIPQESLQRKGFTVETDPNNSLFAEQYTLAKYMLLEIIQSNKRNENSRKGGSQCPLCAFSSDPCECSADSRVPAPIQTIIPFIGPRGTGKTSIMLSFQQMLQEAKFTDLPELGDCRFIGLDYIDAGILKETEDVIALILARMLQFLLRLEGNFSQNTQNQHRERLRRLFKHFDRFFTNLCRLQKTHQLSIQEGFYETGSSLRELKDIASSYETQREFFALTCELRSFLQDCDNRNDSKIPYLVIAIDDVDMYRHSHSNSYTLLEELYEYLSIPGVVLLVAYHEQMLESNCALHVANKFYSHKNPDDLFVREQVHQFLKKVLPSRARIYTPNFVNLYGDEEHYTIKTETQEIPVKKYTLQFLRRKTGVCYDGKGKKCHFFEMRNLRELNDFLQVLQPMADWDECNDWKQKERNLNRMLEYVYNEFASTNLWGDEAREYAEMTTLPIERQICFFINNALQQRGKLAENEPYHLDAETINGYKRIERFALNSYGSLLDQIYAATRCGIYSKQMIHCLLSSYSLELNKLVLSYQEVSSALSAQAQNIPQEDGSGDRNRMIAEETPAQRNSLAHKLVFLKKCFKSILGISVAGDWANRMIPEGRTIVETRFLIPSEPHESEEFETKKWEAAPIGSIRGKIMPTFVVPVDKELFNEFRKIQQTSKRSKQSSSKTELSLSKKFVNWLENIEFFGMFFSGMATNRILLSYPEAQHSSQLDTDKGAVVQLSDKADNSKQFSDTAHFNLFNFVIHSFFWEEYFDQIHEMIRNAFKGHLKTDAQWQALNRALDQSSFRARYKAWAENGTALALPVQHLDLIYNIFKRLADPRLNLFPGSAENREFWNYLNQLYQSVAQALSEQDEYYGEQQAARLSGPFRSCPFVQQVEHIAGLLSTSEDPCNTNQQNEQQKITWMSECIDRLVQISHQLHENDIATRIGMDDGERTGVIFVKKTSSIDN